MPHMLRLRARGRATVLIVGAGDVGSRVARQLRGRATVVALVRDRGAVARVRGLGAVPFVADLDRPRSLAPLATLELDAVVHLAPPPATGRRDVRTRALLAALALRARPALAFVYVSTSGVYGDQGGALVREDAPARPRNPRAQRRLDAERSLARVARHEDWRLAILRAPGLYSADRLPLERLRAGTVAIDASEDSWSNHIHVDDLAGLCIAALRSTRGVRIYNASDDAPLRMGDWFDRVADRVGLPRPPRVPRSEARQRAGAALWSFMSESRRLDATRARRELRYRLRWPDARAFLDSLHGAAP